MKKTPDLDRVFKPVEASAPERPAVKQSEGSAKAKKIAARLAAVQLLYQMRLNNQDAKSAVSEYINTRSGFDLDGDVFVPPDRDLLSKIVLGLQDRWDDVDSIVAGALSEGGRTEVELLLECVLRAGVYEILVHNEFDTGIIINDYLSVTAGFYEGNEPKLVNGILDKVGKKLRA